MEEGTRKGLRCVSHCEESGGRNMVDGTRMVAGQWDHSGMGGWFKDGFDLGTRKGVGSVERGRICDIYVTRM